MSSVLQSVRPKPGVFVCRSRAKVRFGMAGKGSVVHRVTNPIQVVFRKGEPSLRLWWVCGGKTQDGKLYEFPPEGVRECQGCKSPWQKPWQRGR